MEYKGRYKAFEVKQIKTYPISERINKVKLENLTRPVDVAGKNYDVPAEISAMIDTIADEIVAKRKLNKPVVIFTGAHLIKNGLGPLLADLVEKDMVTLVAGNGATGIHDFELAMIGQTSEYVPNALPEGLFGMAYEFCYMNTALSIGNNKKLGYGESLGKMICDEEFRSEVLKIVGRENSPSEFLHPEVSVLARCYQKNIPFTVHVGIGTDVIDQHVSFDGCAKGGCSGRDFLIYTNEIAKFTQGGVSLNIGCAVTGPEVFLKAASMVCNIGKITKGIVTADFDLRNHKPQDMTNESSQCYYFRDQKSIVTRVPQAFEGKGFYVQGNQKQTFPLLYQKIIERIS